MTYKDSYEKCESLEDLRQEVSNDISYAKLVNPDRIKYIVSACEEVANKKFGEEYCEWHLEEPDFDTYETECGEIFISLGGSPLDKSLKYCCYCGKLLKEIEA